MKRIQTERENNIADSNEPLPGAENEGSSGILSIVLLSLAPLYLLLIIGVLIFSFVMLDRHFILLTHFVLQQGIFIAILIIGMAVAIIAYALSVRHVHRTIHTWRQNGLKRQAAIGQLLLVLVASIMILPIILALFLH